MEAHHQHDNNHEQCNENCLLFSQWVLHEMGSWTSNQHSRKLQLYLKSNGLTPALQLH
jgi:hypothetical protein